MLLVLLTVTSCKKSSDSTPAPTYKAPSMATNYQIVQVPTKLASSTDTHAQMAAMYMSMSNAFAGYSSLFNVPSNAVQSQTKASGLVYTWSYGGVTIKLTYTDDATNRHWIWYYNDVKYMECQESLAGNGGSFTIYDIENGSSAVIVYNWTKDATTINQTMKFIDGADSFFFKVSASLDGKSGTFDAYDGPSASSLHIVNVTWLANGTGTWWISYNGQTYSGSWTAQ